MSPCFDLLFVVNVGWLLALLPGYLAADGAAHLEFWQIYFLTTPHRWITLLLVACDGDRRAGRGWLFATLAVAAALVVCGLRAGTGSFACMLLIDFIWNYWHFAAQHAGVLRMYSRRAGGGWPRWETWSIRLLVFYTALRLGGWVAGWLEPLGAVAWPLAWADALAAAPALALLGWQLLQRRQRSPGKLAYLASVVGLYGALLLAIRRHDRAMILALTVASALFHAVEYLAVVTHYAWRRRHTGGAGLFRRMAERWLEFLAGYVLLVGVLAWSLEQASPLLRELWIGLNLWAAALHYGYDGLIWKLRRPETARALDVSLPGQATGCSVAAGRT